jgi:hypothetical protein
MVKPRTASNGLRNSVLSAKQEAAALALAAGRTQDQASSESGAGTRTIKTWLATQPAFACRIQELRTQMTARALGMLVDNMVAAAETLSHLCREGKSESVRLSASRAIVELGTKLRETIELEERIAALESNEQQLQVRRSA